MRKGKGRWRGGGWGEDEDGNREEKEALLSLPPSGLPAKCPGPALHGELPSLQQFTDASGYRHFKGY